VQGDFAAARAKLHSQIHAFPNAKGLHIELAELEARLDTGSAAVPELLRKKLELEASGDKD
jgi:hypothetical protein